MTRLRAVASRSSAPDPKPASSEPTKVSSEATATATATAIDSMGWITLAILSGLAAAVNGMFAKLSTNNLTEKLALAAAEMLGLMHGIKYFEILLRIICFVLNMVCNGVMWSLFTRALTAGTTTAQTVMVNTSANFMATAVLGVVVFSESLPPLWFLGAAMLIVGNLIIGCQDEGGSADGEIALDTGNDPDATPLQAFHDEDLEHGGYRDEVPVDEDVPHIDGITSHPHEL